MSHAIVNSALPAEAYNSLIIDHEAVGRSEHVQLKKAHLPFLFKLLITHGVADVVEPHLLHRHFVLQEGKALVRRTLEIRGSGTLSNICVDVAKPLPCSESTKACLVPLLWMAPSSSTLVAYEYYTRAMWNAAKSTELWITNVLVNGSA